MTEQRQNFIWLIYCAEKGNGYLNLKQSELVKNIDIFALK